MPQARLIHLIGKDIVKPIVKIFAYGWVHIHVAGSLNHPWSDGSLLCTPKTAYCPENKGCVITHQMEK